ncbi:steroid dehydrogenase KIK-I [Cryptosporidium ubiquitum]|uniref:Steroid dehydrogenase KIK-I n=1 Tax=Cryptosporidium ubiquitum TaxID=857276 RepID=A0A1J4MJ35_9CRYT|nr:steroid dehydrogenase KIK-I [Cryptosporidium ubiquitum]OII74206.1 steroid dehydrogenase KIK-I [Cryptosporidium ubiquitum]
MNNNVVVNGTGAFGHDGLTETDIFDYCRGIKSCGECQLSKFCSPCIISGGSEFFCTSKVDSIVSCRQNNISNICSSAWPWWIYLCIILLLLVVLGMILIILYKCCTCFFLKVQETELEDLKSEKKLTSFGSWAIITGASDGIGKALAKELIKEDLNLILIGRNEEKLQNVVNELLFLKKSDSNQEIRYYIMDFTDPTCYSNFRRYLDTINDIGVLINNVGVSYPHAQYFEETSIDLINELIEVNVRSVLMMTHIVYNHMKKRDRGAILCIGSGSSQLQTDPLYSAYAATKSVSESLCRSLRAECESGNITIQCHTPMLVTTKLSKAKKETFFTISAKRFAAKSIEMLKRPPSVYSTIVPYFGHWLQLLLANMIPRPIWNKIRISQTKYIREKALKKKI